MVDNFYPDADKLRRQALGMQFSEPENYVGWRTWAIHPPGIKQRIEKSFRLRIRYWEEDLSNLDASNGVVFSAFSTGDHAEVVGVHYDEPPDWVMLIIYLTPGAPYDTGTSFWQHRKTGLTSCPTVTDSKRLGSQVKDLTALIKGDSRKSARWKEIDRIANVYNRAVLFPGGMLHSATKHFGRNRLNGRLYQTFHFPVDLKPGH